MGSNIILALGALVVFGMVLSSSNRLMTTNTQIAEQNEYYISGLSIGQSIIDEAKMKAFDDTTASAAMIYYDTLASSFTPANKLGTDSSRHPAEAIAKPDTLMKTAPYDSTHPGYRSTNNFNDVDDYNGYQRIVNTARAEGYRVFVAVNYADETNPDVPKTTQTFCKVMTVRITSPFFRLVDKSGTQMVQDTLKLSYAFTY